MNTQIEVKGLSVNYDSVTALSNVSCQIDCGDFVGITGPNGGGKTTFLRTVLGLIKPRSGDVRFYRNGKPVPDLNIGYLPQKNLIDYRFPITVTEVVESGFLGKYGDTVAKDTRWEKTKEMLLRIGLSDLSDRTIGKLSGGQMQRVLLGRALVSSPEVLVLDEPSSYIDKSFEGQMHRLLCQENEKGTTILYVSHQTETLKSLCCRLFVIDGELREIQ